MKSALLSCMLLLSANLALAQTPQQSSPPSSTSPSAASSPHQREHTSTPASEAPTTTSPDPAAASSPHQKKTTEGTGKTQRDKMMNDCINKRQSESAAMSKEDAKKACEADMKK